jgi:hypothetical protein
MPTNSFSSNSLSVLSPFTSASAVTPSNTVDLDQVTRGLQAHRSGGHAHVAISVIMMNDTSSVTLNIPNGVPIALRVKRVLVTGTDATSVVALY